MPKDTKMNKIKFLVFADLHHYPGIFYTNAEEKLEKIKKRAIENDVDMVIHLGDFCHGPHLEGEFVKKYHDFPMPAYHTIGNHENDNSGYEEILKHIIWKTDIIILIKTDSDLLLWI